MIFLIPFLPFVGFLLNGLGHRILPKGVAGLIGCATVLAAFGLSVALWAGFLHDVQRDAEMLEVHRASYLHYRDRLQALITALPRERSAEGLRQDAIACNALIDGLWMEGSILTDTFKPDDLTEIALRSCGAILGADLRVAYLRPMGSLT